ncbi:MAG: UbiH/UbiF family hydroxylase [Burkholderiales bacterium]|jgi:ubiquinone biosynthesis UbiH/UbiF/VisC/COQ6 family hydroxylase|nr:UbiH/UbiF family hydroxylase [Burkholderiales bacterium]
MEHSDYDVVVVGAGLVGAGVAAALAGTALSIAIVERAPPPPESPAWDTRIYAISPASVRFLESVGVWQALDPARIQPVRRMDVSGDAGSRVVFSAYDAGVAALAHIVESGAIQRALWRRVGAQENAVLVCPARCASLERDGKRWRLGLEDGRSLSAGLVVGADGRDSWVRGHAGIGATLEPYGDSGVVANFATERGHDGTAFQWFRADGILAYLPLPGNNVSVVWSTPEAHARELTALDPDAFAARVAAAGNERLGRLTPLTPAAAFPLAVMEVEHLAVNGLALVGDAAHAVHPLAGQGVNLGFGDARVLAALVREREIFRAPGDPAVMRRYERARREDILAMRLVTHGLQRLFSLPGRLPAAVRNLGLNFTDEVGVLKNLLIRQALG